MQRKTTSSTTKTIGFFMWQAQYSIAPCHFVFFCMIGPGKSLNDSLDCGFGSG
jgi:hypothetical protein